MRKQANLDIRVAAQAAGVRLWEIADGLGIADNALSRKLRRELPATEKEKIMGIIQQIKEEA